MENDNANNNGLTVTTKKTITRSGVVFSSIMHAACTAFLLRLAVGHWNAGVFLLAMYVGWNDYHDMMFVLKRNITLVE